MTSKSVWVVTSTYYDDWLLEVFDSEELAYQWIRKDLIENDYRLDDHRLERDHSNQLTKLTKDDLDKFSNEELECYSYYVIRQKERKGTVNDF